MTQFIVLIVNSLYLISSALIVPTDGHYEHRSPNLISSKEDSLLCYSFDCITNQSLPKENIIINVYSQVLRKSFILRDVTNVTLQGIDEPQTIVMCEEGSNTGIQFVNVSGLHIRNLSIENCGAPILNDGFPDYTFSVSLSIVKSKNIFITDVDISNSSQYGVALINSRGTVWINNCTITKDNSALNGAETESESVGMFVTADSKSENVTITANYTFSRCTLKSTWSHNSSNHSEMTITSKGMVMNFSTGAVGNVFRILNSKFLSNRALFGAGVLITLKHNCENNSILFSKNVFAYNEATRGGGAICVSFVNKPRGRRQLEHNYLFPKGNKIMFQSCTIFNNSGLFGGGVSISSDLTYTLPLPKHQNKLTFKNTSFTGNVASFGAAISVNVMHYQSGIFFMILNSFSDCSFTFNRAGNFEKTSEMVTQSGIFFISKVYAYFFGEIRFEFNSGTALHVSSTKIFFENATAVFNRNSGGISAGILLVNYASIQLKGSNDLMFTNNRGTFGTGVCSMILEHFHIDHCFIEGINKTNDLYQPTRNFFTFSNNKASSGIGHDIFVTNLIPCLNELNRNASLFFEDCDTVCFNFSRPINSSRYATSTYSITSKNQTVLARPGIPVELNVNQVDQFGQSVNKLFPLSAIILEPSNGITLEDRFSFITKGSVIFKGKPNTTAKLLLQSSIISVTMINLTIELSLCPPGFKQNHSFCVCNPNQYISSCGRNRSLIKQGNWAGYMDEPTKLLFGVSDCEYRLCLYTNASLYFGSYRLPTQPEQLEKFVCGQRRRGRLCGGCTDNYTVYYNSPTFHCGEQNDLCKYGVLFYILSQIVPITILFLIIIIFNIHLTSGSLYSFIFFAQALDILYVDAFGAIKFKGVQKKILNGLKMFYSVTNLKFFQTEVMSFCLFKDKKMNVMDMFIAQYIPLIYALLLIFATLLILKVNSLYTCIKLCHRCGRRNIRGSVINGLTAFVVLCYFKCVDLTCSILIPVTIYVNEKPNKTVPLFNGELDYMKHEHMRYVIPAFICIIVLILPPPVLLLFESIAMSINRSCRIRRNCFTYFLHRIRMKALPFIDSFQGCFKDNRRCFAGLFFAYKALLLSPYITTAIISHDLLSAEVMLFGILTLHIYCQPFQKPWQNFVDCSLLVNLLLINMLTIQQYNEILEVEFDDARSIKFYSWLQVLCVLLPLVYLGVVVVYKASVKFNCKMPKLTLLKAAKSFRISRNIVSSQLLSTTVDNDVNNIEETLPFRLLNDCDGKHYRSFK